MKLLEIYEKSELFCRARGGELPVETVSLFVTGIVMREILFPKLSFADPRADWSFEQMWFLLCRYHDRQTERADVWERICRERSERRKRQCKAVTKDMWGPLHLQFSPRFQYRGEGIRFTNGARVARCSVSEIEVEDCFCFRNICDGNGGMDHGIAGGLLLYEDLVSKYLKKNGEMREDTQDLYAYAANTLLAHEIWQQREFAERITPEKDPMLFLLLLAETLEPLQYACVHEEAERLLGRIEVEIAQREVYLVPDSSCFETKRWEEKLHRIQNRIGTGDKRSRETQGICLVL